MLGFSRMMRPWCQLASPKTLMQACHAQHARKARAKPSKTANLPGCHTLHATRAHPGATCWKWRTESVDTHSTSEFVVLDRGGCRRSPKHKGRMRGGGQPGC